MEWIEVKDGTMPPTDAPFWATGWVHNKPGGGRWYACARFDGRVFVENEDPNDSPLYVPTHWASIEEP